MSWQSWQPVPVVSWELVLLLRHGGSNDSRKLWQLGEMYLYPYPQFLRYFFLATKVFVDCWSCLLGLTICFLLILDRPLWVSVWCNLANRLWFRRRWRTWMNMSGALATSVGLKSDTASSHTNTARNTGQVSC